MRAHHLPISLLAASVVAIATADVTQQVSPTRQAYRVSGMCDFDQLRTASGNIPGLGLNGRQHCAPTATSNVLAYLAGATPGGISGVPNDSWTDRNADEYASSNTLIATCGNVMQTNVFGNGTRYSEINRGLQFFLPSDEFTLVTLGGAAGAFNGLGSATVVQILATPLFPRPASAVCVGWLQPPASGSTFWNITGGHCFTMGEAIWQVPNNKVELDIFDPADSARIDPTEPTTAQSVFTTAIYNAVDGTYPINGAWTITGGWMQGLSAGTTRGVLMSQQLVFPTTIYTCDPSGLLLQLVRPLRFEYEDINPIQPIATNLPTAVTDMTFDFVSRRIYAIHGSGTSAKLTLTDGLATSTTAVTLSSQPRKVVAGRFGEVFVLGTNGTSNTLTRLPTSETSTPTQRTLPQQPDAICYDDANDRLLAYHLATRTLYVIPRLEAEAVTSSTAPLTVALAGDISMAVNPDNGTVWIAGSGTAGKFYVLALSASGGVLSATSISSTSIVAPRHMRLLGRGKVVFASGNSLRVLAENATAGTWSADTTSRLWGASVGPAYDISRERNNFPAGHPALNVEFAVLPTSTPVIRAQCSADLNLDGIVNGLDLAIVLSEWGTDGLGDLDRNDVVNGADLSAVLASWGPCPN